MQVTMNLQRPMPSQQGRARLPGSQVVRTVTCSRLGGSRRHTGVVDASATAGAPSPTAADVASGLHAAANIIGSSSGPSTEPWPVLPSGVSIIGLSDAGHKETQRLPFLLYCPDIDGAGLTSSDQHPVRFAPAADGLTSRTETLGLGPPASRAPPPLAPHATLT